MKKIAVIITFVLVLTMFAGCSSGGSTGGYAPYGYESLAGCWVIEEENSVYAIQFFSDGTFVQKATGSSKHSGTYFTEKDGTIKMDNMIGNYELSGNTLHLTLGTEPFQRFTRFDKNINFVEFEKTTKTSSYY